MITDEHIAAFGWASQEEMHDIADLAIRVNDFLCGLFAGIGIRLVDFKLEFGRIWDNDYGRVILADEISPDGCRLWDMETNEKLDKDRFRRDLGGEVRTVPCSIWRATANAAANEAAPVRPAPRRPDPDRRIEPVLAAQIKLLGQRHVMRNYLLLASAAMLSACGGGAGVETVGGITTGAGTGTTTTTGTFVAPTEVKTYSGLGVAQHYEYNTRSDGSSQSGQLYAGDANTVRDSGISVTYNPRDAIFELTIQRTKANVTVTGDRFQDPAHRTDFGGALQPQGGVPNLNLPSDK
eukprot:gene8822-11935_t